MCERRAGAPTTVHEAPAISLTATSNPVIVAMEVDVGPGLFFLEGEIFITRGMIAIHKASLHVLQPSDAQAALDSSIALYFAAACSQLIVRKSRGFLVCLSLSSCAP